MSLLLKKRFLLFYKNKNLLFLKALFGDLGDFQSEWRSERAMADRLT